MKNLRFLIIILGICLIQNVQAQIAPGSIGYYQDALRFSSLDRGGTARIQGLAGSGVALGGDLSSSVINPAGLGFYNRSVMSITPQISFRDNTASYLGQENLTFNDKFSVGQIGISIDLTKSDIQKGNFRGGSLAFTFSKRNDFNNEVELVGDNFQSSIADYYVEQANGLSDSFFGDPDQTNVPGLAWWTYLIDFNPDSCPDFNNCTDYIPTIPVTSARQVESTKTTGNQQEWTIAYGGNFNDKFYIGAKIGITSVSYERERIFKETSLDNNPDLQSVVVNDFLEINGSGYDFNLGFIYRPIDLFRIGLSIQTPTIYNLNENFSGSMQTNYNNYLYALGDSLNDPVILNEESSQLLPGNFDYRLRTPLRVNFGGAIFASKNGFITADVEYVDYRRSRVSFESLGGDEIADNRSIQNIYDRAFNFRVGGEYRVDDFRFRGGYANLGDPFKDNINAVDHSRQRISGGLGMRLQDYFWDVALIHEWWNDGRTVYNLQNGFSPPAISSKNLTTIALTGGLFF